VNALAALIIVALPVAASGGHTVRVPGTIQPVHSVIVQVPTVQGQGGNLTLIKLTPNGALVHKGDLLAEFDRTPQLKLLREAEAKADDFSHQVEQKAAEHKNNAEKRAADLQQAQADLQKAQIEIRKGPILSEIDREKKPVARPFGGGGCRGARDHCKGFQVTKRSPAWIRAGIVLLLFGGLALAFIKLRRGEHAADLPTAAARRGDFLVMVRCRGELGARRSVQLSAPLDVPDLQIVWLAPAGSDVKEGQTVIRFDSSRSQQDLKEKDAVLKQAQGSLDQAVAQGRITAEQDKLDLAKARYEMEKARLEASKQTIVSAIQGQESEIGFGLTEEKVTVQESTNVLHAKADEAKIASQKRLRDAAKSEFRLIQYRLSLMDLKSPLNGVISYLQNTTQGWMNAQPSAMSSTLTSPPVQTGAPSRRRRFRNTAKRELRSPFRVSCWAFSSSIAFVFTER
jgi:multidrug efflux pump subunit AcrA (membrane-fusion protein)